MHKRIYELSAQVCAVISQPASVRGRGNKSTPLPTPVEQAAREVMGLSKEVVLCPRSAREVTHICTFKYILEECSLYKTVTPMGVD